MNMQIFWKKFMNKHEIMQILFCALFCPFIVNNYSMTKNKPIYHVEE